MKNPDFIMYSAPVSPVYLADIRRKFYFVDYYQPSYYSSLSRYKDIRTIRVEEDNHLIHETMYDFKIPEDDSDKYYTVLPRQEGRLDVISLLNYGVSTYWWVIGLANNIIDPIEDIKAGMVLRIPSIMSLYKEDSIFGG